MAGANEELDIVVVGAGLTGLFLTHLLVNTYAVEPTRIALLERQSKRYDLPRAAGFSDDTARLYRSCLPKADVDRSVQKITRPGFKWQWLDRHGDVLYDAKWNTVGRSGYDVIQGFHQPWLEDAMEACITRRDRRIMRFNHSVQAIEQDSSGVNLTVQVKDPEIGPQSTKQLRTKWVVGADSANSTIRKLAGIEWIDSGFVYDWLVVDLLPDAATYEYLNFDLGYFQKCDPARPATCVWSGPQRRRFEFMRLPGETKEELQSKTWDLLKPYNIHEQNTVIERSAVYTFRACIAETFNSARCILAGDSAHLTPPFLGQGAQMGIRDAANLAWRLDLVLREQADKKLLDDYSTERQAPCKFLIDLAVQVGKIICVATDEEADVKHAEFRASAAEQVGDPPLGGPGQFSNHHAAGTLALHRPVRLPSGEVRMLDDILGGPSWLLLMWSDDTAPHPLSQVTAATTAIIEQLGIKSYSLSSSSDVTGESSTWFKQDIRAQAVLVRPDFYIADACDIDGVSVMLDKIAHLCRLL